MNFTKKSIQLMNYFVKIHKGKERDRTYTPLYTSYVQNFKTNQIMKLVYEDILEAFSFLQSVKNTVHVNFFQVTLRSITNIYHIPKPKHFNSNSFPEKIRKHIDETSLTEICYTFSLFQRKMKLFFITEESISDIKIENYHTYVDSIIMWLYIVNEYASKKCSKQFTVYFYFTSLTKMLPTSNIAVLNEHHVNTAFTTTCPIDSEIIIYRKEEWFKVFIHETFHNFALDFSDMNHIQREVCNPRILGLFKVDSDVNLYEAYTEFWAEIMNASFCSFHMLKKEKNIGKEESFKTFLEYFYSFMNLERQYSCFQMVKALNFMGLKYKNMYAKDMKSNILRQILYKERSNVLSYYGIKCILIYHYPLFLKWCDTHNLSLLSFKKTRANLDNFCDFIEKYHHSKDMLYTVNEMEIFLEKLSKAYTKNRYLLENMRMTICEWG